MCDIHAYVVVCKYIYMCKYIYAYICIYHMYVPYICMYISQQDRVFCSISLRLTPWRKGISVNLEFSW